MPFFGLSIDLITPSKNHPVFAVMALRRRNKPELAVAMRLVVPRHEAAHPFTCGQQGGKALRGPVRTVFQGPEHRPSPLLWRAGIYDNISRPAQCSLTLWPTDLPRRPFLEVLQPICYLLSRFQCFRPKRKIAESDLHRRINCTLARHTQQCRRKQHPAYRLG
jgi:hypothetical protein